jgi:hypothetical protein
MALRERPTVLVFWVTYEEMVYFFINFALIIVFDD